jgi:hypothetical protein
MHVQISYLRAVCQRCLRDSDPQLRWLGNALNDFLTLRCASVDEALGLRFPRGGMPWWREEATRQRDAALRQLAALHFPSLAVTAQARAVCTVSTRYAAAGWRHDRNREAVPPHYTGTPHEFLWQAFASGAPMPLRQRQLRHILQHAPHGSLSGPARTPPFPPCDSSAGLSTAAERKESAA